MKKCMISIGVVLAVLIAVFSYGVLTNSAFGQNEDNATQAEQRENMREKLQNMSPEEREKFREEMRQRRQQRENMSDEDRAKLREQMREKFGSRPEIMGSEQQLQSIKAIEEHLAKLKVAVETTTPENRSRIRELPQEERTKLREKMMAAMRDRQTTIRAIEQELTKLKGPGREVMDPRLRISELKSIQKLAVEEKATRTAERLERFIARYERESQGRERPPVREPRERDPRQRRERPARPQRNE